MSDSPDDKKMPYEYTTDDKHSLESVCRPITDTLPLALHLLLPGHGQLKLIDSEDPASMAGEKPCESQGTNYTNELAAFGNAVNPPTYSAYASKPEHLYERYFQVHKAGEP